jgi:hypothetical protein
MRRRESEPECSNRPGASASSDAVSLVVREELGLGADNVELLVRESFSFLLEREPASSIMSEFSLDVIEQYFPEYREELGRRLS